MTQKIITRYGKIIPSSEFRTRFQVDILSQNSFSFDGLGPHTIAFYKNFFRRLVFSNSTILYPVRVAEVYVVTDNNTSTIFSSNQKLFKYLVKKGIVKNSELLCKEFREFSFLDFDRIAQITGAKIVNLLEGNYYPGEDDILFHKLDGLSNIHFIPCLHEEKIFIDAFLETKSITPQTTRQLDDALMKEFESSFVIPAEIITEIFESANI